MSNPFTDADMEALRGLYGNETVDTKFQPLKTSELVKSTVTQSDQAYDMSGYARIAKDMGISSTQLYKELKLSEEHGIKLQEKEEGFLTKVLNFARTGEFAVGGIISGKGAVTGIKERISPSEALGISNDDTPLFSKAGLAGLAADILLDPTTYITFGFGASAKVATSAGEKVLNKSGRDFLTKKVIELGEEEGRKAVAKYIMKEGGEGLIDEGGLKFMGQQILSREKTLAPFKTVGGVVKKTPILGDATTKLADVFANAFKPFAQISKLDIKIGNKPSVEVLSALEKLGIKSTPDEFGKG